jgi:hypothetical protein
MDIVERLRKRKAYNAEYDFHGNEIIGDDPDEDCIEAADEIERLQKEKDIMADALRDANDYGMELAHEIKRLREALKEISCSCTDENCCENGSHCLPNIARAALKGDE